MPSMLGVRSKRERQRSPSRSRSAMSNSVTPSTVSISLSSETDRTSVDQPDTAPSSHRLTFSQQQMSSEQWGDIAFSLGIRAADDKKPNVVARKLASKTRKRRTFSDKQTTELLVPLLSTIVAEHDKLQLTSGAFNRDAVPLDLPVAARQGQGWNIRMTTPKPAFTLGYSPHVFNLQLLELQRGIIADANGAPHNLAKISQTSPGVFWPFLTIVVNPDSIQEARDECAAATATCNNALMMLAASLVDPRNPRYDAHFITSLSRAVHSFSLAVSGKTACLMTHNSGTELDEAIGIVRSYDLTWENDVEALAARLESILVWGENTRLSSILELLDRLDKRVNFSETSKSQDTSTTGPMDILGLTYAAPKSRKGLFKSVLAESMPSWSRVEV